MTARIKITPVGNWEDVQRLLATSQPQLRDAINGALEAEGEILRGAIVKGFRNLKPPLSPQSRNKGKPLMGNGDLRNAVTAIVGDGEVFIGVPRTAGRFNLAVIHEQGAVVVQTMTDRMRRFLMAHLAKQGPRPSSSKGGGAGGGRILITVIPARPFIGPAIDAQRPKIPQRFYRHLMDRLELMGGTPGGAAGAAPAGGSTEGGGSGGKSSGGKGGGSKTRKKGDRTTAGRRAADTRLAKINKLRAEMGLPPRGFLKDRKKKKR